MENFQMNDLPSWVLENEEDFPLGAKATPFLPSAIELDTTLQNAKFELPVWMECMDILGLENAKAFEDAAPIPSNFNEKMEETFVEIDPDPPIRPEDMLVPLPKLQPQSPPQKAAANPILKITEPIPKIIICKKVAKDKHGRLFEIKYNNAQPEICSDTVSDSQSFHSVPGSSTEPLGKCKIPACTKVSSGDADEWIDDIFQLIGKDSGDSSNDTTQHMDFNSYYAEDLLSQLESTDSLLEVLETSSLISEPESPVSLPSPVPSVGSLSPHQASSESLFVSPVSPSESLCVSPVSPSESLFVSPVSPSVSEDYKDNLGAHSYSRSPLKRKHHKSSTRKSPYSEDRKERKKEQNKQAALRYRQKKKQEDDDLASKIKVEEKRQKELQTKYTSLKQELGYLKKLMREVFVAKGIISADALKKK